MKEARHLCSRADPAKVPHIGKRLSVYSRRLYNTCRLTLERETITDPQCALEKLLRKSAGQCWSVSSTPPQLRKVSTSFSVTVTMQKRENNIAGRPCSEAVDKLFWVRRTLASMYRGTKHLNICHRSRDRGVEQVHRKSVETKVNLICISTSMLRVLWR